MYYVIVLAEQALSAGDAAEVTALHDAIEDSRHYHVLIPCENAALQVESAISSFAASEAMTPVTSGRSASGSMSASRPGISTDPP